MHFAAAKPRTDKPARRYLAGRNVFWSVVSVKSIQEQVLIFLKATEAVQHGLGEGIDLLPGHHRGDGERAGIDHHDAVVKQVIEQRLDQLGFLGANVGRTVPS